MDVKELIEEKGMTEMNLAFLIRQKINEFRQKTNIEIENVNVSVSPIISDGKQIDSIVLVNIKLDL